MGFFGGAGKILEPEPAETGGAAAAQFGGRGYHASDGPASSHGAEPGGGFPAGLLPAVCLPGVALEQ